MLKLKQMFPPQFYSPLLLALWFTHNTRNKITIQGIFNVCKGPLIVSLVNWNFFLSLNLDKRSTNSWLKYLLWIYSYCHFVGTPGKWWCRKVYKSNCSNNSISFCSLYHLFQFLWWGCQLKICFDWGLKLIYLPEFWTQNSMKKNHRVMQPITAQIWVN